MKKLASQAVIKPPQISRGICPCCKRHRQTIARRQRHCNYPNPEANWLTSCATCFNEDCADFAEREEAYRWDRF